LTAGLRGLLGETLHAIYLYGAVVFPETTSTGDLDLHVIVRDAPTAAQRRAIERLHEELVRRYPETTGSDLDAYYILLADAGRSTPPVHQLRTDIVDDAWALHRAHMLAGRCVVLYGPEPGVIMPPPTWPEIESALAGEWAYVEEHVDQYPDYCVLNACRLVYSHRTRDVVTSKAAAAAWAKAQYPRWSVLIDRAVRSYAGRATDEDRAAMRRELPNYLAFARREIRRGRDETQRA